MRESLIERIVVYDFDQTLIETPEPPIGCKTNWWADPNSLSDLPSIKPIPSTLSDYESEDGETTLRVLMTGRVKSLEPLIRVITDKYNLTFDLYLYKVGDNTLINKVAYLEGLLDDYPNVKTFKMLDDRVSHFDTFKTWGDDMVKANRLESFEFIEIKD